MGWVVFGELLIFLKYFKVFLFYLLLLVVIVIEMFYFLWKEFNFGKLYWNFINVF